MVQWRFSNKLERSLFVEKKWVKNEEIQEFEGVELGKVLSSDCDLLNDSKTHCYESPTVLMYLMVLGVGTLPVLLLGRL